MITIDQFVFLAVGALALIAAFQVVRVRNLIHAALWLVATLFFVAVLLVLLEAGFLAAVQVVLYIGAISILIIFAVMLTRRVMDDVGPQTNRNWWLGTLLVLVLFAGLGGLIWRTAWPPLAAGDLSDSLFALGRSLVDPDQYVLPFEVASILLLIALIGSVVVALPDQESR